MKLRSVPMTILVLLVSLFLALPSWAAVQEKLNLEVTFKKNGETFEFKMTGSENQVISETQEPYRFELRPKFIKNQGHKKKSVQMELRIFEQSGEKEELLMSPQIKALDDTPAVLITEDRENKDRVEIKVTPHLTTM